MAILYVETNFAISVAYGQDAAADGILEQPAPNSRLAIPAVCIMESLGKLAYDQRAFDQFFAQRQYVAYQDDTARDRTSTHAILFARHLREAVIAGRGRLNDVQDRLDRALVRLSDAAEFIALSAAAVKQCLSAPLVNDPTDNLILGCILEHARNNSSEEKGFLSNDRGFEAGPTRDALNTVGVKFFRSAEKANDWLNSRV